MKVTIITPCLNPGRYLPLCAASVADQAGVDVQHIIADGGSSDGTVEWLQRQTAVTWFSRKDRGMYDAINQGLTLAEGDVVAYLNSDEQYLPGTLAAIASEFERRADIDLVHGDMLVVNPDGSLVAYRKSYPLRWPYVAAAHLYVPTCALFWRRRINEEGTTFDPRWRIQGDADYVVRMLRKGYRARHLKRYCAVFTWRGDNLGNGKRAREEMLRARSGHPAWIRGGRLLLDTARRVEKLLSGAHSQRFPLEYGMITPDSYPDRVRLVAQAGSFRWPELP